MLLRRLNCGFVNYLLLGIADLKNNVFINLRKQDRQKMEGFSASQF